MTDRPRRAAPVVAVLAGYAVLLALLAAVVLNGQLHRTRTLGDVARQPTSVRYEDDSVHYAGVIETRSWVLGRHRTYELRIGRDPGLSYGYFVRLGFGGPEQRPVIKTASWDREGVRVTFASGHEVFVPARHYLGGR